MITLLGEKDFQTPGNWDRTRVQEMYIDTDAFYKMYYIFQQFGLGDYFTFEVDQNGRGVYVRIVYREESKIGTD